MEETVYDSGTVFPDFGIIWGKTENGLGGGD
jgi:hypothetical protein